MIRINLLGVERQKAKKSFTFPDPHQRTTFACCVIFGLTILGGAARRFLIRRVVQRQCDVALRFPGALAHDQLVGALAPIDVAYVVALSQRADAQDLVAASAVEVPSAAPRLGSFRQRKCDRVDRWIDDELPW
jgi:hypothetical protein